MKSISKLFNTLAGIFRILVSLSFFWGTVFTIFVDRNLLAAFYDILGFDSIAPEIIKLITAIVFIFVLFINLLVAKRIFKANKTGKFHMSNLFFGIIFLLIDFGIYFFSREEIIYYLFAFSGFLILGSMFGLIAKAKGQYPEEETVLISSESEDIKNTDLDDSEISTDENLDEPTVDESENIEDAPADDEVYESLEDEALEKNKEVYDEETEDFHTDSKISLDSEEEDKSFEEELVEEEDNSSEEKFEEEDNKTSKEELEEEDSKITNRPTENLENRNESEDSKNLEKNKNIQEE